MKNLSRPLAACAAVAAFLAVGSAQATTINFATPTQTLGISQAYGPITAYGFLSPTSGSDAGELNPTKLFGKSGGGGETGLGLAKTFDHEINTPAGGQAIVLDINALSGQDLKIGFGSVQAGEGWRVGFSSSPTLPTNESAFTGYITGVTDFPTLKDLGVQNAHYLIAEATSGNVLLTSLSATTVPEPASMAILALGLVGLGTIRLRRAKPLRDDAA